MLPLAGCAPSTQIGADTAPYPSCTNGQSASLELGTGPTAFAPLSDGDALDMDQGVQGLFHVYGSLRADGVVPGDPQDFSSPTNPIVSMEVMRDGQSVGGYRDIARPLDPDPDQGFVLAGDIVLLDITAFAELEGATVLFSVDLEDMCGTRLHDEVTVVTTAEP